MPNQKRLSTKVIPKKKRGRPYTGGRDPIFALRMPQELMTSIEAWASEQEDNPGRSEAIRRLVEIALES